MLIYIYIYIYYFIYSEYIPHPLMCHNVVLLRRSMGGRKSDLDSHDIYREIGSKPRIINVNFVPFF